MKATRKRSFSRVLPFEEWKQRTNPTEKQIELYHFVTEGIKVAESTARNKKVTSTKTTQHGCTKK